VTWSLGSAKYVGLSRAAAGEKGQSGFEAFQEMFWPARPRFLRIAQSILRNDADAEDALQNACLSAYLHLDAFEGRSSLKSWFTRILINATLMYKRKHREILIGPRMGDDEIRWTEKIQASTPNPEQAYAQEEHLEMIDGILAKMRPVLRQTITMTYYDEMSTQEACAVLGIPRSTFKARLFRARQQLSRQLKRKSLPPVRSMTLP